MSSKPRVPTAHAKLPTILRSLHNAQWGVLGGAAARGQRTVLQTLSQAFLADGSGEGRATLWQIHRASGYPREDAQIFQAVQAGPDPAN